MIKVNIGCGKTFFGNDWVHIDGKNFEHVSSNDIYLKNFDNSSIDIIYSSHFIEYFDREEIIDLFSKWYSKLKKGGKIYLSVPDFRTISKLYLEDNIPLHKFLGPMYGKIELNKKTIYHKTIYDYSSLGELLRFIGFKRIDIWNHRNIPFDVDNDCSLAIINNKLISLNIVAEKL